MFFCISCSFFRLLCPGRHSNDFAFETRWQQEYFIHTFISCSPAGKQCYQIVGFIPKPGIFEGLLGFFFAVWDNPKLGFFSLRFFEKMLLKMHENDKKSLKKAHFFGPTGHIFSSYILKFFALSFSKTSSSFLYRVAQG